MKNKDAFYFSHDSNALSDPKILTMRCDYGMEGYGLYWAIIEMLRNESNYKLPMNDKTYKAIKMLTNTTIKVEEFMKNCINEYRDDLSGHGLFNTNNKYFWSESLLGRMTKFEEVKEKRKEAAKRGAEARWKNNDKKKQNNIQKCESNAKRIIKNAKRIAKVKKFMTNGKIIDAFVMPKNAKENKIEENKIEENKIEENKIEENKNIIKLNQTKLNLFFNFMENLEENFEEICQSEKKGIELILKRLDLYLPFDTLVYLPEDRKQELKIQYWTIKELYFSPYKVYLQEITNKQFILNYLQTEKYIGSNSEDKIIDFVNYFIKCLRESMKNKKG